MKRMRWGCLFLTILLLLTACGNAQEGFINAVKENNAEKAIDIYMRRVQGKAEQEHAIKEVLEVYLEDSWESYVTGSMSKNQFEAIGECLYLIEQKLRILPEIEGVEQDFERVQKSKEEYKSGLDFAQAGDYANAINAFANVVSEDKENYQAAIEAREQAEENYLKSVSDSVEELIQDGSYDDAIMLIDSAEDVVDDSTLYYQLRTNVYTEQFSNQIQEAYNEEDYLSAVMLYESAYYDEYVIFAAEITDIYSECKVSYVSSVTDKAKEAFGEKKDYEAALAVVRNALDEASFSDDLVAELELLIEEYSAYIPIQLTSLEPVRCGNYVTVDGKDVTDKIYTDVNEIVYDTANLIYPKIEYSALASSKPNTDDDSAVVYQLNYNYRTLSGTVFRPYASLSSTTEWKVKGNVKIYGDGLLVYKSPEITQSTYDPIDFEIDVSGIRELKIIITGRWGADSGWYGLYDIYPKVCLGNLMLQK